VLFALERALGASAGELAEPARAKAAQVPLAAAMLSDGRSGVGYRLTEAET
jgi:hypothetical protein